MFSFMKLFKRKTKSSDKLEVEEQEQLPAKFEDVIPDEPSMVKLAYLSIKDFLDKHTCDMDKFRFKQHITVGGSAKIKMYLGDIYLTEFTFMVFMSFDKVNAKYLFDGIQRELKLCNIIEFKLELLNL
jgi:hypothetical protein